ncbi:hypothetical protein [Flavisolibacter tropicus]|uniref:Glycosyl-4,4'-diaponeurosporenoate acyltransferase n=1 Tax=Flavisolibacter tropicus TaxID=1492898 RepID=A0A172TYE4_9BACT|nr:hypothetical protein [Flavisolibacter tropicus]ANE52131.1 hypothetical protein SY85_18175 [Flavisolibacter tropicus]
MHPSSIANTMKKGKDIQARNLKRMVGFYNMLPNLVWSILGLVPISIFCYTHLTSRLFWLFIAISFLPVFLSNAYLSKIQIARTTTTYRKLRVGLIQQLSQNGVVINRLIRRRFPTYKAVRKDAKSMNRLLKQTYAFEKFHYMLFLFYSMVGVYALFKGYIGWAAIILLTNLFYNIYPILLQQYIRLKLAV